MILSLGMLQYRHGSQINHQQRRRQFVMESSQCSQPHPNLLVLCREHCCLGIWGGGIPLHNHHLMVFPTRGLVANYILRRVALGRLGPSNSYDFWRTLEGEDFKNLSKSWWGWGTQKKNDPKKAFP